MEAERLSLLGSIQFNPKTDYLRAMAQYRANIAISSVQIKSGVEILARYTRRRKSAGIKYENRFGKFFMSSSLKLCVCCCAIGKMQFFFLNMNWQMHLPLGVFESNVLLLHATLYAARWNSSRTIRSSLIFSFVASLFGFLVNGSCENLLLLIEYFFLFFFLRFFQADRSFVLLIRFPQSNGKIPW